MAVLLALLSALSNAAAAVFQRLGNLSRPKEQGTWWRTALALVRQPVWLLGLAFMAGTLVFSASALYFGTLAVVQPLLVTELVFTLALRQLLLHDRIAGRSWAAAGLLCLGLGTFLVVAHSEPGHQVPSPGQWAVAVGAWAGAVALLCGFGRFGSPARRATLVGAATGLVWSLDAAFVKSSTEVLQTSGWSGLLVHWPFYAAVVSGVGGTVLLQFALSAGPLANSQAAIVITDPITSIVLGLFLFSDQIRRGPTAVVLGIATLAVMMTGVVLLSRWGPPVMEHVPGAVVEEPAS